MNLSKSLLAYLMVKQANRVFSKEKKQTAATAMEEFGTFAPPTSGVGIHANLIPGAPIAAPAASTLVNRPENNGALQNLPLVAGATASVAPGTPTVVATPKPTAASTPPAAKPTAASAPPAAKPTAAPAPPAAKPTAASAQAPITRTIGRVPTAQPASAPIASEPTQAGMMSIDEMYATYHPEMMLESARQEYATTGDYSAIREHLRRFPSEAVRLNQQEQQIWQQNAPSVIPPAAAGATAPTPTAAPKPAAAPAPAAGTPTVASAPPAAKPTAASAPPAAKPTAASAPPAAKPTAASAPPAAKPTQTGQMPNQASAAPLTQEQSLAAAHDDYRRTNDASAFNSALKAHFKQFPSEAVQLIEGAGDVYKEIWKQVDASGKGYDARAQAYDHRNEWINRDSGGNPFLQGDSSQRYSRTHPENMSMIDGGKGQKLDSSLWGKAEAMMAKAERLQEMQMREVYDTMELYGTPAVASLARARRRAAPAAAP